MNHRIIFTILASLLLILSSCNKDKHLVDITVNLSGLEYDIIPDAKASATEAYVNRIAFAIYDAQGNQTYSTTQTDDDQDFATINTSIPVGEYTFVVVAHCGIEDSDPAAVITSATSATFNQNTFPYLFTKVESVTISGNTSQTVQINMGRRRSSSFQVKITDPTPEDVASLQLIVSPTQSTPTAYSINPTTGFAPSDWKYQKTFPRSHYDDNTFSNHTIALGIMLTDTEQQLDITINALDADGSVLYTRTKTGVTFRQASTTRAQGTFFSSTADGSLIFDTTEGYIDITL